MRGSFGVYYDQFRLGLARNVPGFGGTDQRIVQYLVFPRGLYGSPSFVSSIALLLGLPGGCFSNNLLGNLTDAQIAAAGIPCPVAPPLPFIGVDRLNRVVAAGRAKREMRLSRYCPFRPGPSPRRTPMSPSPSTSTTARACP